MKDIKGFLAFVIGALLTVYMLFHTMSSMLVHDNAKIVLAKRACPVNVERSDRGLCVVYGSVSSRFLTREVEITLADKTVLWISQEDLRGYVTEGSATRFPHVGKGGAILIGLLILLVGGWFMWGAPTRRKIERDLLSD